MVMHWIPQPQGSLKINVHGCSSVNNNDTCFAMIYRDTAGGLRHITLGVIPELTLLDNQLWAIFIAIKQAFLEGYRSVLVDTDNLAAFRTIRNFHAGVPAGVYDIVSQIDICLHNLKWNCSLAYVFPARNMVTKYVSRMAMDICDRIYIFDRPVGGVEELMDWDMGIGLDHLDYVDVVIPNETPDPVNFGVALTLTDKVESLGVGQICAPVGVALDVEMNENPKELNGVLEEIYQTGIMVADATLMAEEAPLEGID